MMYYEKIEDFNVAKAISNIYGDLVERFGPDVTEQVCFLDFLALKDLMPESEFDYIMNIPVRVVKENSLIRLNYRVNKQGEMLSCVRVPLSLFEEIGDDDK